MTEGKFAATLGVSLRTVANWAAHPGMVPRASVQVALDDLLAKSALGVKARFGQMISGGQAGAAGHAQALRVAIAIVLQDEDVLLVRRRDESAGIAWQFPAGIVKPGEHAEDVAVRETLAETGVHCSVAEHIGGRLHPVTSVLCDYFRCVYLAGEPANLDTVENVAVIWAPRRYLSRFIERGSIYPPVVMILEEYRDPAVR